MLTASGVKAFLYRTDHSHELSVFSVFLNVQGLNQTRNFQSPVQVSINSNDRHQEQ